MSDTTDSASSVIVLRPAGYRSLMVSVLFQVPLIIWLMVTLDGIASLFPLGLVLIGLVLVWSAPRRRTYFDSWGVRWKGEWLAKPLPWTEVTEFTPERMQPAWLEVRLRSGRLKNLSQRPTEEQLRVLEGWHARAKDGNQ